MEKVRILIVDDELMVCKSCEKVFTRRGHFVEYTTRGTDALEKLDRNRYNVVFTDLKMMDLSGMEVLRRIKEEHPEIIVVIITGYATIASAVETMKLGAFDYLPKPFTSGELLSVLDRAIEKRNIILAGREALNAEPLSDKAFPGIVGKSMKMQKVMELVMKVAPTDSTVLIMGESGTGKELIARAIHNNSSRGDKKFVAVDCGTLSDQLLASELFGHVKGSFTGAVKDKEGLFEVANRGTIFLDEIGNIGKEIQGKLLRVLQELTFLPVGGTVPRKVDVRMVFATNRDLKKMVEGGEFREDLYYRLYVFPIILPTLRERKEDIADLAYWFLKRSGRKGEKRVKKMSDAVLEALINYDWPGNVRELENTIERMVVIAEDETLEARYLPANIFRKGHMLKIDIPQTSGDLKELKNRVRKEAVESVEKAFVIDALERCGWNVTRAAREVAMQRPNFQALMRKYDIRIRRSG